MKKVVDFKDKFEAFYLSEEQSKEKEMTSQKRKKEGKLFF